MGNRERSECDASVHHGQCLLDPRLRPAFRDRQHHSCAARRCGSSRGLLLFSPQILAPPVPVRARAYAASRRRSPAPVVREVLAALRTAFPSAGSGPGLSLITNAIVWGSWAAASLLLTMEDLALEGPLAWPPSYDVCRSSRRGFNLEFPESQGAPEGDPTHSLGHRRVADSLFFSGCHRPGLPRNAQPNLAAHSLHGLQVGRHRRVESRESKSLERQLRSRSPAASHTRCEQSHPVYFFGRGVGVR